MAKFGSFEVKGIEELQAKLKELQASKINDCMMLCTKQLAARLLAKVIKRTPVGDYSKVIKVVAKRTSKKHQKGDVYTKRINPSGKKGGTLRRGWTVKELRLEKKGDVFTINVSNPVEYASYVEYGHKTRGGKDWVEGRFMLTKSEEEVRSIAPNLLENEIKKLLKGVL